jgi:hypothetical protein
LKALGYKCPHCVLGTLVRWGSIWAKWRVEILMILPKYIYERGLSVRYLEESNES